LESGVILPHQLLDNSISIKEYPNFFDLKKFNLLHAGNLLRARRPKCLVNAYRKFLKNYPEARKRSKLIFLGGNNEEVEKLSQNEPNIYISKIYLKFEEVLNIQMESSVNIIIEAKGKISPFLPGKFPHCIN